MISKSADLIKPDPLMNLGQMTSGGNAGTWHRIARKPGDEPGPHAITGTEKGHNGGLIFNYDANGNMILNKGMDLRWDYQDRLIGLSKENIQAKYIYDYSGARKRKSVVDSGNNTTEVLYINKYSEIRQNKLLKYAYLGRNRVARSNDTSYVFYLYDHLGTVNISVKKDGEMVSQHVHYPFGKKRFSYEKILADYRFTGKECDSESGLDYFEARFYDTVIGIFVNTDPLFKNNQYLNKENWKNLLNPKQLNCYTYVFNNPIIYTDPLGLKAYEFVVTSFEAGVSKGLSVNGEYGYVYVFDKLDNNSYDVHKYKFGSLGVGEGLDLLPLFGGSIKVTAGNVYMDSPKDLKGNSTSISSIFACGIGGTTEFFYGYELKEKYKNGVMGMLHHFVDSTGAFIIASFLTNPFIGFVASELATNDITSYGFHGGPAVGLTTSISYVKSHSTYIEKINVPDKNEFKKQLLKID